MAVSHHLGFYRTGNSAIRSAEPENPCLEPNTEWIDDAFSRFDTKHPCDGQTDGIGVAYTRYSIYAVARKK